MALNKEIKKACLEYMKNIRKDEENGSGYSLQFNPYDSVLGRNRVTMNHNTGEIFINKISAGYKVETIWNSHKGFKLSIVSIE